MTLNLDVFKAGSHYGIPTRKSNSAGTNLRSAQSATKMAMLARNPKWVRGTKLDRVNTRKPHPMTVVVVTRAGLIVFMVSRFTFDVLESFF